MAINVQYQPSAAVAGQAAYAGGLGNLGQWWQGMLQKERMQAKDIAASASRQDKDINSRIYMQGQEQKTAEALQSERLESQRDSQATEFAFRESQTFLEQEHRREMQEAGFSNSAAQADQEFKQKKDVMDYQENLLDERQQRDVDRINERMDYVNASDEFSEEEKAYISDQLESQKLKIKPFGKKAPADQYPEGQGPGEYWYDERYGAMFLRGDDGKPEVMLKPSEMDNVNSVKSEAGAWTALNKIQASKTSFITSLIKEKRLGPDGDQIPAYNMDEIRDLADDLYPVPEILLKKLKIEPTARKKAVDNTDQRLFSLFQKVKQGEGQGQVSTTASQEVVDGLPSISSPEDPRYKTLTAGSLYFNPTTGKKMIKKG